MQGVIYRQADHSSSILAFNESNYLMKKPLLLIVDDNPLSMRLASETLCNSYDVRISTSGIGALEFCKTQIPDLILMDIVMPDLDGLSACKMLKSNAATSHVPIIFLTGQATIDVETNCWEAGCADFIIKPFVIATLKNRVHFHMQAKLMTDRLTRLASVDGLTGVYNRRYLDTFIDEQCKLAKRDGSALGILMIDIDYFKRYNDHYGHIEGDECLKRVAKCVESCLERPTDHVARFGGEEFVVVLPNTPSEGIKVMAQRIQVALAALNIEHCESNYETLTLSIGGVSGTDGALEPAELLSLADRQLYFAKNDGRNCAKIA